MLKDRFASKSVGSTKAYRHLFALGASLVFACSMTAQVATALEKVRFEGELTRGLNTPTAVALGSQGGVFVLDPRDNTVGHFTLDGTRRGSIGKKGRRPGTLSKPVDVAVSAMGDVLIADAGHNAILIFGDDGVFRESFGSRGSNRGEFRKLTALAVDRFGNVYVADAGNNSLMEFSPRGVLLASVTSLDAAPQDIALDEQGRVYVLLPGKSAVARYENLRSTERTLISTGRQIPLSSASQIFVDHRGELFATVPGKHRIYKFDQGGALLASFGSRGTGPGQFSKPLGISVTNDDQVVVADSGNSRVQHLWVEGESEGEVVALTQSPPTVRFKETRVLGEGTSALEWLADRSWATLNSDAARVVWQQDEVRVFGTPGKSGGQLRKPRGMDTALDGRVVVADTGNNRVQVFDPAGTPLYVFGERGSEDGRFNAPEDAAIGGDGHIYVADTGNHRVQVFSDQGIFLTSFGAKSKGKAEDARPGEFREPSQITFDPMGRVIVLDRGNARVQRFSENGDYLDSFGPVPGLNAITLDAVGNLYLGSQSCRCVRVVDAAWNRQLLSFGSGAVGPARLGAITSMAVLGDRLQVVDEFTGNSRIYQLYLDGLKKEKRISLARSYFVPVFEADAAVARSRYRDAAIEASLRELASQLDLPISSLEVSLEIDVDEEVSDGEYQLEVSVAEPVESSMPAVEEESEPPPMKKKTLGLK